jgi:hypothetical protein
MQRLPLLPILFGLTTRAYPLWRAATGRELLLPAARQQRDRLDGQTALRS